MNNSILSWFAATVLLSGSGLLSSAAEPSPQIHSGTTAMVSADAPKLPARD
jgi:hypothetical protein